MRPEWTPCWSALSTMFEEPLERTGSDSSPERNSDRIRQLFSDALFQTAYLPESEGGVSCPATTCGVTLRSRSLVTRGDVLRLVDRSNHRSVHPVVVPGFPSSMIGRRAYALRPKK